MYIYIHIYIFIYIHVYIYIYTYTYIYLYISCHTNESLSDFALQSLIWASHVPHIWHATEECAISRHFTYKRVMIPHRRVVSYKWVMSHMNESFHTWTGQITHTWHTYTHTWHTCNIWNTRRSANTGHVSAFWSHAWAIRYTNKWVKSHIWPRCVPHMAYSQVNTYGAFGSITRVREEVIIQVSDVTHINESCPQYEWAIFWRKRDL